MYYAVQTNTFQLFVWLYSKIHVN